MHVVFEQAFNALNQDLPWADSVRILLGPYTSRELVKDVFLKQNGDALVSWAIQSLSEFANEITKTKKPLSSDSKCDAILRMSENNFIQKNIPDLSKYLKSRSVAKKISKFISELEKFYLNDDDLDAFIEYFKTQKDSRLGTFLELISAVWKLDELKPWGEGESLRNAIHVLESVHVKTDLKPYSVEQIWLYGFSEFTPLEEEFIKNLTRFFDVRILWPSSAVDQYQKKSQLNIAVESLAEVNSKIELWRPHSIWDEIAFLYVELNKIKKENIPWQNVAIYVPASGLDSELYKRVVRDALMAWNIPIHDPTLAGAWKDQAERLWLRDFLRLIASGLKFEELRTWLPDEHLISLAYEQAIHGGAAQWAKIIKDQSQSLYQKLVFCIQSVQALGKRLTPLELCEQLKILVPSFEGIFNVDAKLLVEFAEHLVQERPYLNGYKVRLSKYVVLFEEFLENKSKQESLRNNSGVFFVSHNVWLPYIVKHAFVLGTQTISRIQPNYDAWNWEGLEVRKVWERLHFGLPWHERADRDLVFLKYGIQSHENIKVSFVDYNESGAATEKGILYDSFKEFPVQYSGGSAHVQWHADANENIIIKSKSQTWIQEYLEQNKTLKVSAFEDYLKCPYLFLVKHIQQIKPEFELDLDPPAFLKGQWIHSILEKLLSIDGFFSSVHDAKIIAENMIDDEFLNSHMKGIYRHPKLRDRIKANLLQQIEQWIYWEFENRALHSTIRPIGFEVPIHFQLDVRGAKIGFKGKIDRIDSDGENIVIIDYKSGESDFIGKELVAGYGAQLLMYLFAYSKAKNKTPAGAYYLAIKRKTEVKGGVFFKVHNKSLYTVHARNSGLTGLSQEELHSQVLAHWTAKLEDLLKGNFDPQPQRPKKDCPRCQYQKICSYQLRNSADDLEQDAEI